MADWYRPDLLSWSPAVVGGTCGDLSGRGMGSKVDTLASFRQSEDRGEKAKKRQDKTTVGMVFKQIDSGFSDSSDSLDLNQTFKSLKKAAEKGNIKGEVNMKPNKVTFYSVSDIIQDKSFLIVDSFLDENSTDIISTSFIDDDKDSSEEDIDRLDDCSYQNSQFINKTKSFSDQSIKTITHSNRNAKSKFQENGSLSTLPCQSTYGLLSSPTTPESAGIEMNNICRKYSYNIRLENCRDGLSNINKSYSIVVNSD